MSIGVNLNIKKSIHLTMVAVLMDCISIQTIVMDTSKDTIYDKNIEDYLICIIIL